MSITCSELSCRKKEMLPFQCSNCKNFYCRKHHPYDKHNCNYVNLKKTCRYISEEELAKINKCSVESCCYTNDLVYCDVCKKKFCKKHVSPWHVCIQEKLEVPSKKIGFLSSLKKKFFG